MRPKTPSSMPGATGYFDLTVKRYETGVVSKYLHARGPGDRVLMSGPNSGGHWVDGMAKRVGLVAGGTGITPMISRGFELIINRCPIAERSPPNVRCQ